MKAPACGKDAVLGRVRRGRRAGSVLVVLPVLALATSCATDGAQAFVRHSTSASRGWEHVMLARHRARVDATLSYDRRDLGEYRRLTLVVRRAGRVVIRDRDGGQVRIGAVRGLRLQNVWGSADPETLVEL